MISTDPDNLADESDQVWMAVFFPLLRLLQDARHPPERIVQLAALFRRHVLPTLSRSHLSFMTDDHTPMAMSIRPDGHKVSFAVEPAALPVGPAARDRWVRTLARQSVMHTATDLEWYNICSELLTLPEGANLSTIQKLDQAGYSQFFLGFPSPTSPLTLKGLILKPYFMPSLKASYSGATVDSIVASLIPRLYLEEPWSQVNAFFSTVPSPLRPSPFIVSIDCLAPSLRRAKIYYRIKENSLAALEKYLTLYGRLAHSSMSSGLQLLHKLWKRLLSQDPSENISKNAKNPSHFTVMPLIYFELREGHPDPYPKVYIPIRHYSETDKSIAAALDDIYTDLGAVQSGEFINLISRVFDHRELGEKQGIFTYLSVAMKKGKIQQSPDLSPPLKVALDIKHGLRLIRWLNIFTIKLRTATSWEDLSDLFTSNCRWSDLLSHSSRFCKLSGLHDVAKFILQDVRQSKPRGFCLLPGVHRISYAENPELITARAVWNTTNGECSAAITFVITPTGQCKALSVVMQLEALPRNRPRAVKCLSVGYHAVVVGGGLAGLSTAARLGDLGMKVLVVEKDSRVGGSWRNRYTNLKLNTPRVYSALPFFYHPDNLPEFMPATSFADRLEAYSRSIKTEFRHSTLLCASNYNPKSRSWSLSLRDMEGSVFNTSCHHLIIASGIEKPRAVIPDILGLKDFSGHVAHASNFRSSKSWAGKRTVVIGSGCSAHDVAKELYTAGAESVTLVQRSATAVMSRASLIAAFPGLYNGENYPPVEFADRLHMAGPYLHFKEYGYAAMRETEVIDRELRRNLTKVGFILLPNTEADNFMTRLLVRHGGYYIDSGCSQLIIDEKIGLLTGTDISHISGSDIIFRNGTSIQADLIVFGTGYTGFCAKELIEDMSITHPIASTGGEVPRVEIWQKSTCGEVFTCRVFSRLLALQIQAEQLEIELDDNWKLE
ncbi:predicted protein [Uncinocarpus reesii 1704]|uniref:FAD/NAD(P)-binding domain-containing protein n=1 Tax=Uncinocarpus reesii (strain UAMH 1704) TaxID=336963 RepID=C4JNK8_UNCRE|nr:uncharacterized protein UREG_03006 [Uncinocarpus reesii 1704]EEP78161.1 predicted protein [Uncinocarpus reesii 1704]